MVQQSRVVEFLAVEIDEAELQIAIRFGVFAVGVQKLLVTAEWHFVVPDYDAIEVLTGTHMFIWIRRFRAHRRSAMLPRLNRFLRICAVAGEIWI